MSEEIKLKNCPACGLTPNVSAGAAHCWCITVGCYLFGKAFPVIGWNRPRPAELEAYKAGMTEAAGIIKKLGGTNSGAYNQAIEQAMASIQIRRDAKE